MITSISKKTLLFFLCFYVLLSCQPDEKIRIQGFAFDTYYAVTYIGKKDSTLAGQIDSLLNDFSKTASVFDSLSIVSKVNTNQEVALNEDFKALFSFSEQMSRLTGGAFDATVGPLVNVWGFGKDKQLKVNQEIIDSVKSYVGYKKIQWKEGKIIKADDRMQLNFNAIAKGYIVDKVAAFMRQQSYTNCLIDIGGEVYACGQKLDENWEIGIQLPTEDSQGEETVDYVFALKDKAVATSGNYRRYHEENGQRFSHIINPETGQSERSNLLSVTVVADDCIRADALATALMVMGLDKAMQFLKTHPEYAAYFIYDENGTYKQRKTKNFPKAKR